MSSGTGTSTVSEVPRVDYIEEEEEAKKHIWVSKVLVVHEISGGATHKAM